MSPSTRKSTRNATQTIEAPPAKRPSVVAKPVLAKPVVAKPVLAKPVDPEPLEPPPLDDDLFTRARDRVESFSSDASDEQLDAIDREIAAEEAAAANARTSNRLSAADCLDAIKDIEVDNVCESLYDTLEEAAMMDLLRDAMLPSFLQGGLSTAAAAPATKPPSGCKIKPTKSKKAKAKAAAEPAQEQSPGHEQLWHVVATPAMMRQFSSVVANGPMPEAARA